MSSIVKVTEFSAICWIASADSIRNIECFAYHLEGRKNWNYFLIILKQSGMQVLLLFHSHCRGADSMSKILQATTSTITKKGRSDTATRCSTNENIVIHSQNLIVIYTKLE